MSAVRFGIFIYDGVEPIDLATFGVLSMARRIAPEIEICTIAPQAGPVALANGLKVIGRFRHRRCAGLRSRDRHRRPRLARAGGSRGDARLYQARSCLGPHRLGLHRRHDPGRQRHPRWRPRDHQTRSGAAGKISARSHARQLSANRRARGDAGGARGRGGDRRRGFALHRHHAASAGRHARPARRR